LFLANFTIYIIGMGLFPVLPLYAGDFGASAGMIGLYMALAYIAITAGSLAVGWIPATISRKKVFVVVGAIGVPALVLLGQVTGFWQIVLLTAIVWFSGGVGTSLTSVFTGVIAEEGDRGRSFSLMFLAKPLAGIVGGFLVAWLVEWGGYTPTFNVMALIWAAMPIVGLIGLPNDKTQAKVEAHSEKMVEGTFLVGNSAASLGWQFNILLVMLLLATIAAYSSRLGISLSLIELNFDASDAASVAISSSLITLPLVPMIGSLSDRLGRHRFLIIGSLMATAGSLILLAADQLWQFWLSGGLLLASMTVTATVASAMGTDLLTAKALNRGLPRLSAMTWTAGIIGFLGAGYLVESLGSETLYIGAVAISIMASVLVLELRPKPLIVPASVEARLPTRPYDQCLDEATEFTVPCSEMV
jgi:MFS family permease